MRSESYSDIFDGHLDLMSGAVCQAITNLCRLFGNLYQNFRQWSSVDDLLDSDSTTLETLMQDNEVLNEVKLNNNRLVEL